MKTYKPNMYRYTDTITFSKRHPAHVMIGIVRFRESDPYGCDDSGKINLIERRDEFMSQGVGVVETPSGWKEAVSTNEHGLIYTYYPDYYDTLGTEISQIYDMFSTNLFVQASINYFPHGGSPEWEEVSTYECELGEKYGTCGLTKWLREGRTSKGLKADFDALDRLIRTLVVKNQNPVPLEPVNR